MIEKTIRYAEVKPSKPKDIKPVKQGGRLNYLGKQKTVTAPIKWKSGPTHPETHLAYITKQEQDILVELDLYKSMNGKPNKGPFGLPSLNDGDGSGGNDGGASGGSGGVGGSDAAGDAGNATGDSAGVGGSGGPGAGPGGGAGSGPGGESGTGGVDSAADAAANAASDAANAVGTIGQEAAAAAGIGPAAPGIMDSIAAMGRQAIQNAINNPVATAIGVVAGPVAGLAARGIGMAVDAANRGVTAPNDFSQVTESVQTSAPSPSNTGGISTIQAYAPLYNPDTGNPTMDAYMRQLRINLGLPV